MRFFHDDSGFTMSNDILKWWSTASRAMKRRMISEVPSKIRLMRKSRIARSIGIGSSPRARRESAVS
jgi:hypothetical protein